MKKVFNVSKPRSATQSMNEFLNNLGYRSMHWIPNHIDDDYDSFTSEKDMIDAITPLEETFNAFNDFPYTILYDHFANKYPDAQFIMINRDPDDWYNSFKRLLINKGTASDSRLLTNFEKVYYGKYIEIDYEKQTQLSKKQFIEFYEAHKKEVENYFSGTGRLLSIHLSDNNISEKICQFLGIVSDLPFPNKDFLTKENI